LYGGVCAYYYRKDDFISALSAAKKFNMPGIFWGSLYRLACYGQLNRKDQIKSHIKELKNLKPDFEEKAPHLISRYIKEEDLVIKLMDGLRKAGLKISLKPVPS
jgi:5,10-methylenetetrahydrofolate reductase